MAADSLTPPPPIISRTVGFSLAAYSASFPLQDSQSLQRRQKWMKSSKRDELWEKAHECNAKRVLKLIVELEGLWVKLGQYMSTRADMLSPADINHLKQLQDSLPPRNFLRGLPDYQPRAGETDG